jgi:hypothetical protein
VLTTKSDWSGWYSKANRSVGAVWPVVGFVADPTLHGGLTCPQIRLDRPYESDQNVNLTSLLCRSCWGDRNTYVECLIHSLNEGDITLGRSAPHEDWLDRVTQAVRPGWPVESELGVVFWHGICISFDHYWGNTSPPYKYKESWPIEGITIETNKLCIYFLSSKP